MTRVNHSKGIISKFENQISDYFESEEVTGKGLPSVQFCAEQLHLSLNYLGDLLKQETGKSAIEHIHYCFIEKAKSLLLNTTDSISEIAYGLGFGQPQNFSKLFKKKTEVSPAEYRSLN